MVPGSVGVTTFAVPTLDSAGHEVGLAANVASRHAFCNVVRRDGSCLGSVTFTLLTLAPPDGIVSVVSRRAPFERDTRALLAAANFGLNDSAAQFWTWNGLVSPLWIVPVCDSS